MLSANQSIQPATIRARGSGGGGGGAKRTNGAVYNVVCQSAAAGFGELLEFCLKVFGFKIIK